jgi:hypothetical protein
MIFVAKDIYVFVPNLCILSCYVKTTPGELIMSFGLTEIVILNFCMFSIVNL